MTRTDLAEIIRNGESSGMEFKRDDVHPDRLAREISALANFEGGRILLGIEDDGTVTGLTRDVQQAEEWVMNLCRNNVRPSLIPFWERVRWDDQMDVGIVSIRADSPDKPYKASRGAAWVIFIRVGTTSREATREEEQRLYQASGLIRYDSSPVSGSSLEDLDRGRLVNYFGDVRRQTHPPEDDHASWEQLLFNTELLAPGQDRPVATVGALLLFGRNPNRYLPQAGITATAYPGREKEYNTVDEEAMRGSLVSMVTRRGRITEPGVIDRAIEFVRRNMGSETILVGGRRQRKHSYPLDACREAIVNAVAHRDYTIAVTDIELSLYEDRLEVISPGRLPNTVTVERMKQGYRAARNELVKEMLRDYDYIEARGMGVPYKIIAGMQAHNRTQPDLIEEETRFIVRLYKGRPV